MWILYLPGVREGRKKHWIPRTGDADGVSHHVGAGK